MLYETDADRAAQRRVLTAYCAALQRLDDGNGAWKYVVRGEAHHWDAEVGRAGRSLALVEVKVRQVLRRQYRTYKIDCQKIDRMLTAAEATGHRVVLVVEFRDGAGRLLLSREWLEQHARISTLARLDRGDPHDTDWVYEWSNDHWVPLGCGYIEDGDCRF